MRKLFVVGSCVAAIWLSSIAHSLAGGGTFMRGCAARDMQIMTMLETSAMTPQQLDDAMRTMVHARMMCFDGQVVDALALYEQIAHGAASAWVLSGSGRDASR